MSNKQTVRRRQATAAAVLGSLLLLCCLGLFLVTLVGRQEGSTGPEQPALARGATLSVAYSPEKAEMFAALAERFNAQGLRTPDREVMRIAPLEMTPEEMVAQALSGQPPFQALTPDSSLWFDQLNRRWAESEAGGEPGKIAPQLVVEPLRYAVSPIVIAAWEASARALGWPDRPVGWKTLQERAQQDPSFRWSHPSTAYASGLLATLAEFYAGAGVQRGLTADMVQDQATLDYVSELEKTVRYYGEGELAAIERAAREGPGDLDAFVVSEQLVAAFNQGKFGSPPGRLVALYPAEGTLWADHPLGLLETSSLTPNQRRTYQAFREFLSQPDTQDAILQAGYRPADLSIPLDSAASPLNAANGIDPLQPQTTLQLPTPDVVTLVQNVWALTKRKTNVFLVVDTSGSMSGPKLENAQAALRTFLASIPSDQDRVGLVEFNTGVTNVMELDALRNNREEIVAAVEVLEAGGNTALLDGVLAAYRRLQREGDAERINAIVAMTDGRENASVATLRQLASEIRTGNQELPVVIFAVAYGRDADYEVLDALAQVSGGQVREGTPETIRELYKLLSSYF